MATPQLSPGVLIREVDLTVGRADNVLDNIGAIAGPFAIGPVDEVVQVNSEVEFIDTFGKPKSTDAQYEYWMSASSYLSYGGVLKVVRTGGTTLNNANAGVGIASTNALQVLNYDDYQNNHESATDFTWAAKNPGSWANGLKVCVIDDLADQTIGINTTNLSDSGAQIGYGVTASLSGVVIPGSGTTASFTGYLKGIITGVSTSTAGQSTIDVKVVSRVETVGSGSTETKINYQEGTAFASFDTADSLVFVNNAGINTGGSATAAITPSSVVDWYDQQTLGLNNSTVYWKSLAPRPTSNLYSTQRAGEGDALHVVVVDDDGDVTGIQGNVLEKHINLSKSLDAVSTVNSPQRIYYKEYIAEFSKNVYAGYNPSQAQDLNWSTVPRSTGFSSGYTPITTGDGLWGQNAQGVTFSAIGNITYSLTGGGDYSNSGGFGATLGALKTSYQLFENKDEVEVDYLIMGPGLGNKSESQAKANYLIALAEQRQDCMALIGPHRADLVNVTNTSTQTDNLIEYYTPLTSSSYAVFDSGYKYTYDRFNNEFRYIPCNADVAGMLTRTAIVSYPWYSPAGQRRGVLRNAVKLAYNPTKAQRDKLYPNRINSFITKAGQGTFLFGDKTALSRPSAFDRINVRRLFIVLEKAISTASKYSLFEFNDAFTRARFVSLVAPYLEDVKSRRGVFDFKVVCDETNNTPERIDRNEFWADIYIKPTRSINFIQLNFIATRTGANFNEFGA